MNVGDYEVVPAVLVDVNHYMVNVTQHFKYFVKVVVEVVELTPTEDKLSDYVQGLGDMGLVVCLVIGQTPVTGRSPKGEEGDNLIRRIVVDVASGFTPLDLGYCNRAVGVVLVKGLTVSVVPIGEGILDALHLLPCTGRVVKEFDGGFGVAFVEALHGVDDCVYSHDGVGLGVSLRRSSCRQRLSLAGR